MRPAEMNRFCSFTAMPSLSSKSGAVKGKEAGDKNSRIGTSKLCTLCSSGSVKPTISAFEPKRDILMRYVSEDWVWA